MLPAHEIKEQQIVLKYLSLTLENTALSAMFVRENYEHTPI